MQVERNKHHLTPRYAWAVALGVFANQMLLVYSLKILEDVYKRQRQDAAAESAEGARRGTGQAEEATGRAELAGQAEPGRCDAPGSAAAAALPFDVKGFVRTGLGIVGSTTTISLFWSMVNSGTIPLARGLFEGSVLSGTVVAVLLMVYMTRFSRSLNPVSYTHLKPEELRAKWEGLVEAGVFMKADTLDEIAEAYDLPADALSATVEEYNGCCAAGVDEAVHKDPATLHELTGPYYATKYDVPASRASSRSRAPSSISATSPRLSWPERAAVLV